MARAARLGDGWLPVLNVDQADETVDRFRTAVAAAGREPSQVGLENIVFLGSTHGGAIRNAEDGMADIDAWRRAGASGIALHTMGMGYTSAAEHIALLRCIADMLSR